MEDRPYFVEMRGCINCSASKLHKERNGTDYGFDHEIVAKCVLMGCISYGHDICSPFFDPPEIIRLSKKIGTSEARKVAREACQRIEDKYGEHYRAMGVSIPELMAELK